MAQLDIDITALQAEVVNDTTVMGSAETLINGIAGQISAAVQAALAQGATPQQLAAVEAVTATLTANDGALAAAVAANTPGAPAGNPSVPATVAAPAKTS